LAADIDGIAHSSDRRARGRTHNAHYRQREL
jgi:hypothetical protein